MSDLERMATRLAYLEARIAQLEAAEYVARADTVDGDHAQVQGARAYSTADQTIATATETTLNWNSEDWDTDGIHEAVTNPDRLTCKTAGKYLIAATVTFAANTTGLRVVYIKKNVGLTLLATSAISAAANAASLCAVTIADLAVDDYVVCRVYQNSGGDLKAELDFGSGYAHFAMQRVG